MWGEVAGCSQPLTAGLAGPTQGSGTEVPPSDWEAGFDQARGDGVCSAALRAGARLFPSASSRRVPRERLVARLRAEEAARSKVTHRPELSRTEQPDRSVDAPPTQRPGSRWSRRQAEAEGGPSPDRTVQRGPREAGPDTPTSRSSGANGSYQVLVGRAGRGDGSPRPAPCVLDPPGPRFRFPRLSSPTVC